MSLSLQGCAGNATTNHTTDYSTWSDYGGSAHGGPPWTTDLVNGDHFWGASSTPTAVSGYPSITVPAGFAFGLPVGISSSAPLAR